MRFTMILKNAAFLSVLTTLVVSGCASPEADVQPESVESSVRYVELERGLAARGTTPSAEPTPAPAPAPTPSVDGGTPAAVDGNGKNAMSVSTSEADAAKDIAKGYLADAEQAYRNGEYARAARLADMAIDMDGSNTAALALQAEILRVSRGSSSLYGVEGGENVLRSEAQYEVKRRVEEAERHLAAGAWAAAIESAESALDVIRWSGNLASEELWRFKASEVARQAKERRDARRAEDAAAVREQQRREEEMLAMASMERYREEVRTLYTEARDLFDRKEYDFAALKLNQILRQDPYNKEVIELLGISEQLKRGVQRQDAFERFNLKWRQAFAELETAGAFPLRRLEFASHEDWQRTEARARRVLRENDVQMTKADIQVRTALETVLIPLNIGAEEEVPLAEVFADLRRLARVPIVVTEEVDQNTVLSGFELNPLPLKRVLDIIKEGRFSWRVEHGALIIDTADAAGAGQKVRRLFNVADVTTGLRNFKADEPRLSEEDSRFNDDTGEAENETEIDGETLIELIRAVINPTSWEDDDINIRQRTLVVNNDLDTVNRVEQLLDDLRRSTGLVVNVEARFITIRDDFLEDIGIDFRGVGGTPAGSNPVPVAAALDDVNFGTNNVPAGAGTDNEAGFFFQDINNANSVNNDIRGRVENLFDQAVGGRRGGFGLTNFGGASFQFAFIDNPEINAVLRAVKKKERAVLLTAPAISVHNTQRGYMSVLNEISYISDFEVNVSASAAIADPVVEVIRDGIVLDVRPTVSADRRYVTLEMRPTLATLLRPISTISTSLGVGPPVAIQTPELQLQRVRTTVTVPDGGSFLIGGLRRMVENDMKSGVPILSDIPLIGWLFTRKSLTNERQDIIVIISVSILDLEEQTRNEGY